MVTLYNDYFSPFYCHRRQIQTKNNISLKNTNIYNYLKFQAFFVVLTTRIPLKCQRHLVVGHVKKCASHFFIK